MIFNLGWQGTRHVEMLFHGSTQLLLLFTQGEVQALHRVRFLEKRHHMTPQIARRFAIKIFIQWFIPYLLFHSIPFIWSSHLSSLVVPPRGMPSQSTSPPFALHSFCAAFFYMTTDHSPFFGSQWHFLGINLHHWVNKSYQLISLMCCGPEWWVASPDSPNTNRSP